MAVQFFSSTFILEDLMLYFKYSYESSLPILLT